MRYKRKVQECADLDSYSPEYHRAYHAANKKARNAARYARNKANPERFKEWQKRSRERLREQMFAALGERCSCCGELRREFLTIEHLRGDGAAHKKRLAGNGRRGQAAILRDFRDRGWPKDEVAVMCWNCNCSRHYRGYCPHEKERQPQS